MIARVVLVLMLCVEVVFGAYSFSMTQQYLPTYQNYLHTFLSTVIGLVFLPTTLVFLFSTFCQLNDKGELLYDSFVARIARRISEDARERGEINYCPTFWKSIFVVAVLWVMAGAFIYGVGWLFFNVGGFFSAVVSRLPYLVLSALYCFVAYSVTKGASDLVERSSKSDVAGVPVFVFLGIFFVAWPVVLTTLYHGGAEYAYYHNLYFSGVVSLYTVAGCLWAIATLFYLWAVCGYGWGQFKRSMVWSWLGALSAKACPRVKIASK